MIAKKTLMIFALVLWPSINSYSAIQGPLHKNMAAVDKKEVTTKLSPEEIKDRDLVVKMFSNNNLKKEEILKLKNDTLKLGVKAVPGLIEVMKNGRYSDKNRWVATFVLGRIMGHKSAPFVSKFILHPNWVMRMASLKTLLALKQDSYKGLYAKALQDDSFIVRFQALENVSKLKIESMGPYVWAMLYDRKNYYQNKKGSKRSNIVKSIIRTVGDLKFKEASKPLMKMVQKDKYDDIFDEVDYALVQITGKNSPKGNKNVKRVYWSRLALQNTVI